MRKRLACTRTGISERSSRGARWRGAWKVSRLPEELGDLLDEALGELARLEGYELDFEPAEPKGP